MKWRNNLFIKLIAAFAWILLWIVAAVGALAGLYMLSKEAYIAEYTDTTDLVQRLWYDASEVVTSGFRVKHAESNLVYQVFDDTGKEVQRNFGAAESLDELAERVHTNTAVYPPYGEEETAERTYYTLVYGVRADLPVQDEYARLAAQHRQMHEMLWPVLVATAAALAVSVIPAAFCLAAAGHKEGREEIVLNPFDRLWLELLLAGLFCTACLVVVSAGWGMLFVPVSGAFVVVLVPVLLSVVRRLKARTLWRTTLLYRLWQLLRMLMRHTRITIKAAVAAALYTLVQFVLALLFLVRGNPLGFAGMVLLNILLAMLVVVILLQYEIVRQATARMAEGELDQVVEESDVPFFSGVARNLNRSGEAIRIAVDKATRSERMKTELITNVSHDIKTPLTSIISYVGLLKAMPIENEQEREYVDILDRKSRRLGQLMNDLVEASKVTTGAVSVNIEPIDLGELVRQASAEFESRMAENDIALICRIPEQPVIVLADGRHMWRVLDNLFGNAVKYAMPGTRVYADLTVVDRKQAVLLLKNVSRDPLNIPPDELTERFVRGDASRNTEGSGLGLSIAQSLMALQNGTMEILIDGDLFKVRLGLRTADETEQQTEKSP